MAPAVPGGGLSIAKTISVSNAVIGDSVSYTITASNSSTTTAGPLDVQDVMPVGLQFVTGSAQVGGVAATPTQTGNTLTFSGVTVPPGSSVNITLDAIVGPGADGSSLTNRANLVDPATGQVLGAAAQAILTLRIEPLFECSDLIGRVFDDLNHSGYPDASEPGIPGAQVVTAKGLRITSDEHGRYHIPCGVFPEGLGSNFILKLDERSLPTGYRLTTENPRVVFVTKGKFAKMNFGASLSRVVRIDLNRTAFDADGELNDGFKEAIQNMVRQMADQPAIVRLTYVFNDRTTRRDALDRVRVVERTLSREWRDVGQYKLTIERTVKRGQ